jgi:hydrogenase maturation protein HypF
VAQLLHKQSAAVEIQVTGTVQGVGFRPHVYKLATSLGLHGWVINTTAGVTIRIEGSNELIERFTHDLQTSPPPLARIEKYFVREAIPEGYSAFFIHESRHMPDTLVSIPPDIGTCPDCLREYLDPGDRRHGYEFTNCTNCGPRFSITKAAPYDRKNTSMRVFEMCPDCGREYTDPLDRRFHAEPNACPLCGPQIVVTTPDGEPADIDVRTGTSRETAAAIRKLLKQGSLLAVKGIGGYHLACDAESQDAVRRMRERKRRQSKPFALMCRDLDIVRHHCELSQEEERLLTSPARPILLLKRKATSGLCDDIAPGLDTLGIMLPYTPLHCGLFDEGLSILVMTSANISGDPLILTEDDAYEHLGDLADYFVIHKREIINRADDSVVMQFNGQPYFVRRARGYVPQGVKLPHAVKPVLAVGGDLKSVFAYGKDDKAIVSQYFGDLDNLKNLDAYGDGIRFFSEFLHIKPELIVRDLHPDYVSTEFAEEYASKLSVPLISVQHHKAHFASCMADNGLNEKTLGVVCDGTGYGDDGTVWGGEFFYGDYDEVTRVGSLAQFPQPRGDSVQKYPLHMAAVILNVLWADEEQTLQTLPDADEIMPFAKAQSASERLSIPSSSCGRLFDAAAALCGFTGRISYEGEAAMRMESLAHSSPGEKPYDTHVIEDGAMLRLAWDFIGEMAEDKLGGVEPAVMAARFHQSVIAGICRMVEILAKRYGTHKVVLSGGTFQNRFVIMGLDKELRDSGIEPLFHRNVPANDSGLALGQIVLAGRMAP